MIFRAETATSRASRRPRWRSSPPPRRGGCWCRSAARPWRAPEAERRPGGRPRRGPGPRAPCRTRRMPRWRWRSRSRDSSGCRRFRPCRIPWRDRLPPRTHRAENPSPVINSPFVTPETLSRLKSALSGRYDVKRELARGGMGQVFEARDQKHGRSVAIKVLDPELAAAIGPARFRAEIEIAARLSHPHIVPLFDSGEADGLLYYVMPLLTGESLRQKLLRERQLPLEDAIRISRDISDALHYAHEQGLVHRDVKRVGDIARDPDGVLEGKLALATIGTPTYMSPEQTSGGSLDGRSDQYSLACVVYEMLTGQPPFSGPSGDSVLLQHRTVDPRPVSALRPTTPGYVTQSLAKALAKAPADRYPSMAAFGDAITSAVTPPGRGTPGGQAPGRVMIAVLPLENRSAD